MHFLENVNTDTYVKYLYIWIVQLQIVNSFLYETTITDSHICNK